MAVLKGEHMGAPSKLPKWIFIVGVTVVVLLWGLFWFCENKDRFESLSALFSGLAFVGLIVTLFYQKQELVLQRQELADTRIVLKETAQANVDSADLARKNLRAQYIIFWLQQNADIYRKAAINWEQYSRDAELLEKQHNIFTRDDVAKHTNDTVVITLSALDKNTPQQSLHHQEAPKIP